MVKIAKVLVVLGWLMSSGLVSAEVIYTNDFGTQAQLDEWARVKHGSRPLIEPELYPLNYYNPI